MPQPVSNTTTIVSGSLLANKISYVVDGQGRDYRGGYNGLAWMSEAPAEGNVIFIGNSTTIGRGPAEIPLFYPSFNTSDANIIYAVNKLPGSPGNLTTLSGAYNWATTNNFFINNSDNPISRINADGMVLFVDGGQPTSYPQTGGSWYDLSGKGNTGALTNSPTWDSNGWFDFDGVDDWVRLSSLALSTTAYTKIAWFNPDGATSNIISGGSDGQHAFWMAGTSTNLQAGHNGAWSTVNYSPGTMTGRWWMGAVTFNTSTGWVLYLNGSVVGTNASTTTFTGGTAVRIAAYTNASNLFNGKIATAQVYDRVLSDDDIKQNYFQGNIVTDGLVFMTDASNLVSYPKSGTTTYSLTGSATGSLTNGVGFSSDNGGSWVFDGVDDYIDLPFNSSLDVDYITAEVWIKSDFVTGPNTRHYIMNGCSHRWGVIVDEPNTLRWFINTTTGVLELIWVDSLVSQNDWMHITCTYDGSLMKIYVNGAEKSSSSHSGTILSASTNGRLMDYRGGGYETEGLATNFKIYNKALTATEIQQNYEATKYKFQGPEIITNGLVMNVNAPDRDSYPGTGTTITDLTGNSFDGTLQNGVEFQPNTNSLLYDGSNDQIVIPNSNNFSSVDWSMGITVIVAYYIENILDFNGVFRALMGVASGSRSFNYYLYGPNAGSGLLRYHFSTIYGSGFSGDIPISNNTWYIGAFTSNGSTGTYYHNGSSIATQPMSTQSYTTAGGLQYLGRADNFWKGNVKQWLIYNRELSSTEISQMYTNLKSIHSI